MDNINHPDHYEKSTSLECIDVMKLLLGNEGLAYFCMGNAFKYMWRYKNKGGYEDLEKANWYLTYIDTNDDVFCSLNELNAALYEDLCKLLDQKMFKEKYSEISEHEVNEAVIELSENLEACMAEMKERKSNGND